jgi:hypothetical protein
MKVSLKAITPLFSLFVFLGSASPALADAGVFFGNGQDLHQITSKSIHLISIDVTIALGEGVLPASPELAGLDKNQLEIISGNLATYRCIFVLQSLSDQPEEVQVGFPVESSVVPQDEHTSSADLSAWVKDYHFNARDEKNTYPVEFVRRKPKDGPNEFGSIFTWKMQFAPRETRTLIVTYQIAISMGLASTGKEDGMGKMTPEAREWYRTRSQSGAFRPERLDLALMRGAGYITSTGSSWSGNVESATFTLITDSFEQKLEQNGIPGFAEQSQIEAPRTPPFPLQHPMWFRKITPDGWKAVKGGLQWSYRNYKPKDSIGVAYYLTQLPNAPEDVDKFVDWFLKRLEPTDSAVVDLIRVKDVVLATYGKEPEDSLTKRFVEDQLWYAPRKDFSYSSLNTAQKSVLANLDARIEIAKGKK